MKRLRIVIFAKAPLAGFAKTRLIPALGSEGAAALARRLLEHTVNTALAAGIGPVELCVTPSVHDALWQTLDLPGEIAWSEQGEGDLGIRMARATERVTGAGESILLVGCDCAELVAADFWKAATGLGRHDVSLTPSADGGYLMLGLHRYDVSLFEDIAWSTDTVAAATLSRIAALGWSLACNPVLHDIDEPGDLQRLPRAWREAVENHDCGARHHA